MKMTKEYELFRFIPDNVGKEFYIRFLPNYESNVESIVMGMSKDRPIHKYFSYAFVNGEFKIMSFGSSIMKYLYRTQMFEFDNDEGLFIKTEMHPSGFVKIDPIIVKRKEFDYSKFGIIKRDYILNMSKKVPALSEIKTSEISKYDDRPISFDNGTDKTIRELNGIT